MPYGSPEPMNIDSDNFEYMDSASDTSSSSDNAATYRFTIDAALEETYEIQLSTIISANKPNCLKECLEQQVFVHYCSKSTRLDSDGTSPIMKAISHADRSDKYIKLVEIFLHYQCYMDGKEDLGYGLLSLLENTSFSPKLALLLLDNMSPYTFLEGLSMLNDVINAYVECKNKKLKQGYLKVSKKLIDFGISLLNVNNSNITSIEYGIFKNQNFLMNILFKHEILLRLKENDETYELLPTFRIDQSVKLLGKWFELNKQVEKKLGVIEELIEIIDKHKLTPSKDFNNKLELIKSSAEEKTKKNDAKYHQSIRKYIFQNTPSAKKTITDFCRFNSRRRFQFLSYVSRIGMQYTIKSPQYKAALTSIDKGFFKKRLAAYIHSLKESIKKVSNKQLLNKQKLHIRNLEQINTKDDSFIYSQAIYDTLNWHIKNTETRENNYFGLDLSDNSDSDEEEDLSKSSSWKINTLLGTTWRNINDTNDRDNVINIFNTLEKKVASFAKKQKPILDGGKFFSEHVNGSHIIYEQSLSKKANAMRIKYERVKEDIATINAYRDKGKLQDILSKVATKFVIAEFRGIHYDKTWQTEARRKHRRTNEVGKYLFSSAVYEQAKVNFTEKDNHMGQLLQHAKKLKQVLLNLREIKDFSDEPITNLLSGGKKNRKETYNYHSAAHFLQDRYTKSYDQFFELLNKNKQLLEQGGKPVIPGLENTLFTKNPFISTGDIPLHALKYAYGIKPYASHRDKILDPCWNIDGQAERPYSGKIYVSLHPLSDYDIKSGPFHLISLTTTGKVKVPQHIIAERETTFPAYLEKDRIAYTHIAKYPSFHSKYKKIFLYKYGLDRQLYNLFAKAIKSSSPHCIKRKYIKQLLGEYLCNYQQIGLIQQARFVAERKEQVIVYLDSHGRFSLALPNLPIRNSNSITDHLGRKFDEQRIMEARAQYRKNNQ